MEQSKSQELYDRGITLQHNQMTIASLTERVTQMVIGGLGDRKTPIDLLTKEGQRYLGTRIDEAYKLVLGDIDAAGKQANQINHDYARARPDAAKLAANYQNN